MTTDERIEKITTIVDALASTVVAHDHQIESLIRVGEIQGSRIEGLIKEAEIQGSRIARLAQSIESLERQWQAYINTLPRQ